MKKYSKQQSEEAKIKLKSSLGRLIILELEEYWSFPVFELVVFTALLALLSTEGLRSYIFGSGLLYHILIVATIIPRSFAGSMSHREIVTLLSYPVKRWKLLSSKIVTNLLMIVAVFAFAVSLNIPLLNLSTQNPDIYVTIAVIFIQLLYLSTIVMTISLALKNEVLSVFTSILLLFGLEFSLKTFGAPLKYFTLFEGNNVIFNYLAFIIHPPSSGYPVPSPFTFEEFAIALGYPLLTSAILLAILFIYFERVMQID